MPDATPDIACTADIVAAYVEHNKLPPHDLPNLIAAVHDVLKGLRQPAAPADAEPAAELTPLQIRRSITPSHIISFEDGRPYKTMRRHLRTRGMTPDDYRAKWGLPAHYPMTAPDYSRARSAMAKALGLGSPRDKKARPAKPPAELPTSAPTAE